jgi:copper resistance protein B
VTRTGRLALKTVLFPIVPVAWLLGAAPGWAQPSDSYSSQTAQPGGATVQGGLDARHTMPENPFNTFVLFDQLEAQSADSGDVLSWDLKAWAGRDFNKIWLRSEGERRAGDTEHAELQLLWGHTVARWWDLVAGVRRDFRPGPGESWGAVGIQGLAPYRFELEATAYAGESGRTAARLEAEYELLMTNRLILQPRVEVNWYGREDRSRGIGTGLADAGVGLRLRYEFRREVAPYIGVVREKKFGRTADLARAAGGDAGDTRLVAGIRLWF